MGDFKTKNGLKEAAEDRETRSTENKSASTIKAMIGDEHYKSKIISAKVYPETWTEFTAINRAQGMTNNSVINMLISKYVRENKVILENS